MSRKSKTLYLVVRHDILVVNPKHHFEIIGASMDKATAEAYKKRQYAIRKTVALLKVKLERARYHVSISYTLMGTGRADEKATGEVKNDSFDLLAPIGLSEKKIRKLAQKKAEARAKKNAENFRAKKCKKVTIEHLW